MSFFRGLPKRREKPRSNILRCVKREWPRHRKHIRTLECVVPGCSVRAMDRATFQRSKDDVLAYVASMIGTSAGALASERGRMIARNKGLRRKVFERDQGICASCGRYSAKWEHDHVVPLHLGGADTLDNSVTRCRSCHRRKSNGELTVKAKTDRLAERHALTRQRRAITEVI